MKEIKIKTKTIQLDQFLKWSNIVLTGGEAKSLIQAGKVRVNNEVEKRRSHNISEGDIIELIDKNIIYKVSR
jgi:ribosome-associated protein